MAWKKLRLIFLMIPIRSLAFINDAGKYGIMLLKDTYDSSVSKQSLAQAWKSSAAKLVEGETSEQQFYKEIGGKVEALSKSKICKRAAST